MVHDLLLLGGQRTIPFRDTRSFREIGHWKGNQGEKQIFKLVGTRHW